MSTCKYRLRHFASALSAKSHTCVCRRSRSGFKRFQRMQDALDPRATSSFR